ncbi:hypothetical protein [Pseudomonas phage IR-QUMS-PaBa1-GHS-2021]|nr:hypothetical protein [Pseudomonas phage IR-QUMS-PaBa1-GHS-2021]HDU8983264.1 hypothetical protein [Pseudomonas aeruginosa]
MNPVDHAINRVVSGSDIDEYLLKLAFETPNANYAGNWYNLVNQTTVEQGIREKVIHRIVLPECNVAGGKTELLDLGGSMIRDRGNGCVEVNVPEATTRGAKIISVTEVYLGSMSSAVGQLGAGVNENTMCGSGVLNDMMDGLLGGLSSNRSMPVTFTNVHMTGNNCFVIFGLNAGTYSMSAKVIMEYDEGMSSIHPRHYRQFAELVELAVKAYIYKTCRRPTQEAVYRSGVPLDAIRDDIQAYSDAWTQYKEYFKNTWINCMTWSDKQARIEAIRMATPRRN